METLVTLAAFVERCPQTSRDGHLNYAFLGGTAVRLHQERADTNERRPISDFDLLRFNRSTYPVHSCSADNIFGSMTMTSPEALACVTNHTLGNNTYFFMDENFLTVSKTSVMDTLREKDYEDLQSLASIRALDIDKLESLYKKSDRITKKPGVAINTLLDLLTNVPGNIKLFQTFPRLVNFLAEFKCLDKAYRMVKDYSFSETKNGHKVANVIYDCHAVLRDLNGVSDAIKIACLRRLFADAREQDYRDFDRYVHNDLIPRLRNRELKERAKILLS